MAFNDWSDTAGDNTSVGGINIGEGMYPSGVNNAMREIMAELAGGFSGKEFTATGTTTARSLADRFHSLATVLDFGADPSGANDSAPAVQAMIDAGIRTVYFPDQADGTPGRYKFDSLVKTPPGASYSNDTSTGVSFVGASERTTITRENAATVNFTDDFATAQARFRKAAIALCGNYCRVENLCFDDCYIGIYIGDDPDRTDLNFADAGDNSLRANCSFITVKGVLTSNCGLGIFSESSKGNYYSHFDTVHHYQCQVGFASKDLPSGSGLAAKVNRSTFTNCRANRCVVGFWLRDFRTNTCTMHTEDCKTSVNVPAHLNHLPTDSDDAGSGTVMIPGGMSTGAGIIVESTSSANQFLSCEPENCDIELYYGGADDIFVACGFDDQTGKVIFDSFVNDGLPYFYQAKRTQITPYGVEKPYGAGAAGSAYFPTWAKNAGRSLKQISATDNTPFIVSPSMRIYVDPENRNRFAGIQVVHVGDVEKDASFEINLGTPRESTNRSQDWAIRVTGSSADGGNRSHHYRFYVSAGNTSTAWNKAAIVDEAQYVANGIGTSASSTVFSSAISVNVDGELIVTVTVTSIAIVNDISYRLDELV